MILQGEILSENQIITMLQKNNSLAWESLYDKYGPAMYSLICKLTDDTLLAEQILTDAFIQLKKKGILSKQKHALCATLLRYTYFYATTTLKQAGINSKPLNPPKETKLVHLLTTQCSSIKEAAFILASTEEDTKKRLHRQFLELQTHNNISPNVHRGKDIFMDILQQT